MNTVKFCIVYFDKKYKKLAKKRVLRKGFIDGGVFDELNRKSQIPLSLK